MEVGDSFIVEVSEGENMAVVANHVWVSARAYGNRTNKGGRVWRVS
jgi:hypothetical protein